MNPGNVEAQWPVQVQTNTDRMDGIANTIINETITVNRARAGDTAAFEELFDKYKSFVWNVAYRMTCSFEESEDLTQEVFVSAWKALGSFKGRSSFSTWLYRITVNKTLNTLRRRSPAGCKTDERVFGVVDKEIFMRQNPGAGVESCEVEQALSKLLERLDPDRRMAVVLREIEGLSYEQISGAMDVPVGTVKSRIARAREDLARFAAQMEDLK